jgi:23S rRNA A1618 N6-methylase RlmF
MGIDIGCGASCIYPLLGRRLFGWRWVASELDLASVAHASANVKANSFEHDIAVTAVDSPQAGLISALKGVTRVPNCRSF